jgi:osmotically-inducible protein OsmY
MTRSTTSGKRRMSRFDTRPLVLGALAGAVLEYLWDPESGRGRRAVLRDQFRAAARHGSRRLSGRARYFKGSAHGVVEETVHLHYPDNPDPDDATLRDRVESELFRDLAVPKGHININVAKGVVELRGQVERNEDIAAIEAKVRFIEGVHTIHNYLHLANTPAPNKARVLSVS